MPFSSEAALLIDVIGHRIQAGDFCLRFVPHVLIVAGNVVYKKNTTV